MVGSVNCVYETPCGWCSKWDKKCDKKIQEQVIPNATSEAIIESVSNKICKTDFDHDWEWVSAGTGGSTFRCKKYFVTKTIPSNLTSLRGIY